MTISRLSTPEDFPACTRYCYLNAASVALMHRSAGDAIIAWQTDLAENGTVNFTDEAEVGVYDDLRSAAGELFCARNSDIAVGSSTTELMSSLAWSLAPDQDQTIVGTSTTFPTTMYPWQRVARQVGCKVDLVDADSNGHIGIEELLARIDERTAIVALSHVEFRTGQTYDLRTIATQAHKYGARLVVDATQSAGQVPIDVLDSGVDAIVAGGYKWLCGPFGAAVMYLSPGLQEMNLDPGTVGWRSHENIWDLDTNRLNYPDSARRFEAGTMAYGCAIGLARAIEHLNSVGVENILSHNKALNEILRAELANRGAVFLTPEGQSSSIETFVIPGRDSAEMTRTLNEANVNVSYRASIRVSPHLYNNENDIGRLIEVVDEAIK